MSIQSIRLDRGERKDDHVLNRRSSPLLEGGGSSQGGDCRLFDQAIAISVHEARVCDFHHRVIEGPSRRIDWVHSCLPPPPPVFDFYVGCSSTSIAASMHTCEHAHARACTCVRTQTHKHVCVIDDQELLLDLPRFVRIKPAAKDKKRGEMRKRRWQIGPYRGVMGQGRTFSPMLPSFFFSLSIPALKPYPLPPPDEPAMPHENSACERCARSIAIKPTQDARL
jgi:hypothetical protein